MGGILRVWASVKGCRGAAKRPKQTVQLGYARVTREGTWMAIVCEDYPSTQISKGNFVAIQKAISWLVDGPPEEEFTPRLVDAYWGKGAAIMVCQDQDTCDWLAGLVPTMTAWEGSRLKIVGLEGCGLVSGPSGGHRDAFSEYS
jgi:hypothetical protein